MGQYHSLVTLDHKRIGQGTEPNNWLVRHYMSKIRDVETGTFDFRHYTDILVGQLLIAAHEHLPKDEPDKPTIFTTGAGESMEDILVHEDKVKITSILRAGEGFSPTVFRYLRKAMVYHLGMRRNEETLQPELYSDGFEGRAYSTDGLMILTDPMLATGGSSIFGINILKEHGFKDIIFLCLVGAPEGVQAMQEAHPDVEMFGVVLDRQLNEHGYILPGLGDAGDRLFNT